MTLQVFKLNQKCEFNFKLRKGIHYFTPSNWDKKHKGIVDGLIPRMRFTTLRKRLLREANHMSSR